MACFKDVGPAARETAPLNLERLNGKEKVGWKVAPSQASRGGISAAFLSVREPDAGMASSGGSVRSVLIL